MTRKSTGKHAGPPDASGPDATLALASTRQVALANVATRREHDMLGEVEVPADAYWGVHTLRAVANFPITGVPVGHFPELVRALALVKQAAARANRRLGQLPPAKADAIDRACELIAREGRFLDQFVVDAVQGGAGTSTNMNANEVIANVALELMGRAEGRLCEPASQRRRQHGAVDQRRLSDRAAARRSFSRRRRWSRRCRSSPTRSRPRRWSSPTC